MNKGAAEFKKIFVVCCILLVLLGGTVIVRMQKGRELAKQTAQNTANTTPIPTSHPPRATYKIVFDSPIAEVGDTIAVKLLFTAENFIVTGSDVYLEYDPSFLTVETITPGDYFLTYPRKTIDKEKGMVKITGFQSNNTRPLSGPIHFATIVFSAKEKGEARLSFDFEKDKTNKTTVVEKGSAKNILDEVSNAEIRIQ